MTYIGIDPGASGSIAVIHTGCVHWTKNTESPHDMSDFLKSWKDIGDCYAFIELVSAMPKQGVSSTFKFGASYGLLRGLLVANRIPFEEVTPVRWQNAMKCRSGGDKNVTKRRAQQLFPDEKITHANADAILLAEYCRRTRTITPSTTEIPDA